VCGGSRNEVEAEGVIGIVELELLGVLAIGTFTF
jgi:hypothetical protein